MDNTDKQGDSGEKADKTSEKLVKDSPEADARAYRAAIAANPNKRNTVSPDGQSRFCLTDENQSLDKDKVLIAQDFGGLQKWGQERLQDAERLAWPHRGKEDQFVDYAAARVAMHVSGLDKLKLPQDTIAAILRNEQTYYKFSDAAQDKEARETGQVLKDGKENERASIGPAQMQTRNIRRLIAEQDDHGKPKFPYLQHMKDDPVRSCLDKKNAALLVGAYLQDEIAR